LRFADETPESIYRVTLNLLLADTDWGLELRAQLRMILDAVTYNARLISWHYKWRSNRGISVTFRPRPAEVAPEIQVLYQADSPSYPSAHSTIAGAASHLLSQCFPQHQQNLDDLADNIGMSCLWAGINYRSDHQNGLRLGRAVATVLLQQMGKP
jgi:membrane-associated phospholipid phosphatase